MNCLICNIFWPSATPVNRFPGRRRECPPSPPISAMSQRFRLIGLSLAVLGGTAAANGRVEAQSRFTDADLPALRLLIDAKAERARLQNAQFEAQNTASLSTLKRWSAMAAQWERERTDPLTWLRSALPQLRVPPFATYDPQCSFDRSTTLMGMVGKPPIAVFSLGEGSTLMEAVRRGDKAAEDAEVNRLSRSPGGLLSGLMPQLLGQSPQEQEALRAVTAFYRGESGLDVQAGPSSTQGLLLVQSSEASGDSLAIVVVTRAQFFSDFLSECEGTLPAGLVLVATMRAREVDVEAPYREAERAAKRMGKAPDALMSMMYTTCRDAQPDDYQWLLKSVREETGRAREEALHRQANVQWYRRHEADLAPRMRAISAAAGGDDPCG